MTNTVGVNFNDGYTYIGFTGALLILLGFYRTSIGRWTSRSFIYELDNLAGAILLVLYQLHYHIYVTLILNVVWAIVAFRGLTSFADRYNKLAKRKRRHK